MSLQLLKPESHVILHDVLTQAAVPWGSEQTLPQWPQLLRSLFRLVSQPSAYSPLQSAKPESQKVTVQTPLRQMPTPLATMPQPWPQAPQLSLSLKGFTQVSLQWIQPLGQQKPLLQWGTMLGQRLPQPPQLLGSICVFVQAPPQLV
jgi:hypothetical protein